MRSILSSLRLKGLGGDLLISLAVQGIAALLGLLLVKLSVTFYPASAFGLASLVLGLHSLLRNILLQPFLQYFILHYWDVGHPRGLAQQIARATNGACLMGLPFVLLAALCIGMRLAEALLATSLVAAISLLEAYKSIRLLPLHLHQAQTRYGLYVLLDAAAKPAFLLLAVAAWGPAPLGLVLAHLAGASLVFLFIPQDRCLNKLRGSAEGPQPPALMKSVGFLWPIALVGVAGWITGLSDRYVVARTLGIASAGHYAALYGLFAAPFLIYVTSVTNVLRPKLQQILLGGDRRAYQRRFRAGFGGFLAGAFALAALLFALRDPLITLLLRPEYHPALPALPGVLLGQVCMAAGLFLEMDFYVRKRTRWVMAKQGVGALIGLVAIPLFISWKGMAGAGIACIAYFGADLATGLLLSIRSNQEDQPPSPDSGNR